MPVRSPDARLGALRRDLVGLSQSGGFGQRMILGGIQRAVLRGPLREEFRTGVGPDGPWAPTVRGKQALESKKLPGAFEGQLVPGGVIFEGNVKRDWLLAQHLGHRFAARAVQANKQFLTFNRAGRLIKSSRALGKLGRIRRGVHQTFAKAHVVSARVLPARKLVPTGTQLPPTWVGPVTAGAEDGLRRWMTKVAK